MWHRTAAAAALFLAAALPAPAQVSNVYSKAVPPDARALERLNLKLEWTANIPVEGRRDSLTQIQTIDGPDGAQIFVQTRTGLLIAGDAATGQLQWFAQLGNGEFANTYSVAANSEYVYAAHVTKLHAFHRYTGVVEFVAELDSPPTAGLAADETGIYCVLGMRTRGAGAHRIAVFNPPRPIAITDAARPPGDPTKPPVKDPREVNPVDNLMNRYSPQGAGRGSQPDVFGPARVPRNIQAPIAGQTSSRTASLSALPRVTPPYTLENEIATPAIGLLPSLRQPYRLRNDHQKDIQQTPSIGVIPPSVAAALALTDLRPRNVQPQMRWEYGLTSRILYPLFLTPTRVWALTDAQVVTALNKIDKKVEALEQLTDPISAPPARAGMTAYIPLGSGYVVAVEGNAGSISGGLVASWRTGVGGIANRTPFVTEKHVFAHGDGSGVVCLDRATGAIVWRTDSAADRVIASTEVPEAKPDPKAPPRALAPPTHGFVYVRDRQGRLMVFDAARATDPANKRSAPLGSIDLAEFNVHITNTVTDRIYLAADNGLIVCLRDMSPKFARPVRIAPAVMENRAAGGGVEVFDKDKKEPEKKEEKN